VRIAMRDERWMIIGLGNEFMRDDGLGIYALRKLREKIAAIDPRLSFGEKNILQNVILKESTAGGLEILDYLIGYRNCILLDAVFTGNNPPGTIYRYVYEHNEEPVKLISSHQINLSELLGLAKLFRADIPSTVIIYGMEVEDAMTFSPGCTVAVQTMLPQLVEAVWGEICMDRSSAADEQQPVAEFPRWSLAQSRTTGGHQIFEL
jgi:hydrogenase maturation protease